MNPITKTPPQFRAFEEALSAFLEKLGATNPPVYAPSLNGMVSAEVVGHLLAEQKRTLLKAFRAGIAQAKNQAFWFDTVKRSEQGHETDVVKQEKQALEARLAAIEAAIRCLEDAKIAEAKGCLPFDAEKIKKTITEAVNFHKGYVSSGAGSEPMFSQGKGHFDLNELIKNQAHNKDRRTESADPLASGRSPATPEEMMANELRFLYLVYEHLKSYCHPDVQKRMDEVRLEAPFTCTPNKLAEATAVAENIVFGIRDSMPDSQDSFDEDDENDDDELRDDILAHIKVLEGLTPFVLSPKMLNDALLSAESLLDYFGPDSIDPEESHC